MGSHMVKHMGKRCACRPVTAYTQMLMESLESEAEVMFLIVPLNANAGLDCCHLLAPLIDFTECWAFVYLHLWYWSGEGCSVVSFWNSPAGRKATLLSNEILNWTFKMRNVKQKLWQKRSHHNRCALSLQSTRFDR